MTEVYLIRHTQAEGNLYRAMQGHWDGDVTTLGWQQIACLAERFRDVKIDALYSSDLYRTRMTASAITKYHSIPLKTDPALREINVGPWETCFFGDLLHDAPEPITAFLNASPDWKLPGAETYADVQARVYPALCRIAAAHEGQTVAIVSHGISIRCMLAGVLGAAHVSDAPMPIFGNTAVSRLTYENGSFTIDYSNDSSHLDSLQQPDRPRVPELRGAPLKVPEDHRFYEDCYADAWQNAHGSLHGFSAGTYYSNALRHLRENPAAVQRIYVGDEPAGLVDMDTSRGEDEGYGWVSFLYLLPEYRQKGFGIQLLGRPILFYKKLGRKSIRLTVADSNTAALDFYRKWGFRILSSTRTENGLLHLMERSLEDRLHV